MSNVKYTLIATGTSVIIALVGLELSAYIITEARSMANDRPFVARVVPQNCKLDGIDSLFGYGPGACKTPSYLSMWQGLGFYRTPETTDHTLTIMTLGGSTTDPVSMSDNEEIGFDTWPRYLAQHCQAAAPGCQVVNGGRAAFTSSQELMMLVRDGLVLRPQIVVSLNGINEFYGFKDAIFQKHPFVTRQQRELMASTCRAPSISNALSWSGYLPNTMALVRATQYKMQHMGPAINPANPPQPPVQDDGCQVNLGLTYDGHDAEVAEVWKTNVKAMQATAQSFGAKYYVFLQPTLGVGKYVPTDPEDLKLYGQVKAVRGGYGEYLATINEVYVGLRTACAELDFCIDLTDLFEGESDVYADPRHPNRKGNQRQAAAIWQQLKPGLVAGPEYSVSPR